MEIFPSTLRKLKDQGVKLVNYNPDNPFVFSGRGSGNSNVADSVNLFDLYLSYDSSVCNELKARKVMSGLLPFGFDVSNQLFDKCKDISELLRPCFIGNADSARLKFLNELASKGIEIDVYGANWDTGKLHRNISFMGYAGHDDLYINLRRYRVQLNLMRVHNPASHNMRSFEIPAIGGIQLAPDTPDHCSYFLPEKEIFLFRDVDECALQINKLLSLSSEEAGLIRGSARNRCLISGYSYCDRARELANHIAGLYPAAEK
jgi:spore maturation protein CgeB